MPDNELHYYVLKQLEDNLHMTQRQLAEIFREKKTEYQRLTLEIEALELEVSETQKQLKFSINENNWFNEGILQFDNGYYQV